MQLRWPLRYFPHIDSVARQYRGRIAAIVALSVAGTLLEGFGIGLIIPLVSAFDVPGRAGPSSLFTILQGLGAGLSRNERVMLLLALIFGAIALKNVTLVAAHRLMARVDGDVGHTLRTLLAERALTVGYPFFLVQRPGRIVHIITTESWRTSDAVRAVLIGASAAASAGVALLLLALLDWRLFVMLAFGLWLIRRIEQRLLRRSRDLSERVSGANARLADRMVTTVSAMRPIRVFGQESFERDRFAAASAGVRDAIFAAEHHTGRVPAILDMLHVGLLVAVILLAVGAGIGIGIPVLVAFLVLLQRAQPYLRTLEQVRSQFSASWGGMKEVEWLLDMSDKPARPTGVLPFAGLHSAIRFEDVSFRYPGRSDGRPALSSVSFSLPAGQAIALAGDTGSGKSTVVGLLCRLIDPTGGRILVDGAPLDEIDPAMWRRRLGLAGQDIELIDGTIAENIAYGLPGASDEQIRQAAELVDLGPLIRSLRGGYDTQVGPRGLELSGGQRQKIGLARALIREPDILILDEATSAMDQEAEARVLANIHAVPCAKIMISHRPATLQACEGVIRLADGSVVSDMVAVGER